MTEETKAQIEQKPSEAESTQTLESLYDEYNVGVSEPEVAAPTPEQQPAGDNAAAIQAELAAIRQELAANKAAERVANEEADLRNAVAILGAESGLEGKESVLKGYLIGKATEDQRLRTLWENRSKNPKAWKKALEILGSEVKDELSIPNPQLEENQRALEDSQRTSSASPPPATSAEERLMKLNPAEFANEWARLAGRG